MSAALGPRRAIGARIGPLAIAVLAFSAASAGRALAARVAVPSTLAQADSLAATASTPPRDKALAEWARHATANDLAWLLRRPPAELGGAESAIVEAALANTPSSREALRQRWLARRLLAG